MPGDNITKMNEQYSFRTVSVILSVLLFKHILYDLTGSGDHLEYHFRMSLYLKLYYKSTTETSVHY